MKKQKLKYQKVSLGIMNKQINLRLPAKLKTSAESYSKKHGYGTLQEFIKELLREKLFEPEISKKELALIMKIKKVSDKYNLYGTEEDLFKELRRNRK